MDLICSKSANTEKKTMESFILVFTVTKARTDDSKYKSQTTFMEARSQTTNIPPAVYLCGDLQYNVRLILD